MRQTTGSRRARGFTLIEAIVVLALMTIAMLIGYVALHRMIHRSKVIATISQIATEARAARLESVKTSLQHYLQADFAQRRIALYSESGAATGFDPATDTFVRQVALPPDLQFWGPPDVTPMGPNATPGLPVATHHIAFRPDGTTDVAGSFRFGDELGNFLEVRVDPPGSARVQVRKWDGTAWRVQGELGKSWKWST